MGDFITEACGRLYDGSDTCSCGRFRAPGRDDCEETWECEGWLAILLDGEVCWDWMPWRRVEVTP